MSVTTEKQTRMNKVKLDSLMQDFSEPFPGSWAYNYPTVLVARSVLLTLAVVKAVLGFYHVGPGFKPIYNWV